MFKNILVDHCVNVERSGTYFLKKILVLYGPVFFLAGSTRSRKRMYKEKFVVV